MLTRRHFAALAAALRRTGASERTVLAVADACTGLSPRFDRDRFIAAAGITAPAPEHDRKDRWND